jgi:hypothetical protein
MKMFDSLSDAQVAWLANKLAKEAKERRADLAPGEYQTGEISLTVPGGTVKVGDDGDKTPTVSVPLLSVLTIALHRAGFQRKGILDLVVEAATTAINDGNQVGTELDTTAMYVENEMKALKARFAADLPRTFVRGKVTVK